MARRRNRFDSLIDVAQVGLGVGNLYMQNKRMNTADEQYKAGQGLRDAQTELARTKTKGYGAKFKREEEEYSRSKEEDQRSKELINVRGALDQFSRDNNGDSLLGKDYTKQVGENFINTYRGQIHENGGVLWMERGKLAEAKKNFFDSDYRYTLTSRKLLNGLNEDVRMTKKLTGPEFAGGASPNEERALGEKILKNNEMLKRSFNNIDLLKGESRDKMLTQMTATVLGEAFSRGRSETQLRAGMDRMVERGKIPGSIAFEMKLRIPELITRRKLFQAEQETADAKKRMAVIQGRFGAGLQKEEFTPEQRLDVATGKTARDYSRTKPGFGAGLKSAEKLAGARGDTRKFSSGQKELDRTRKRLVKRADGYEKRLLEDPFQFDNDLTDEEKEALKRGAPVGKIREISNKLSLAEWRSELEIPEGMQGDLQMVDIIADLQGHSKEKAKASKDKIREFYKNKKNKKDDKKPHEPSAIMKLYKAGVDSGVVPGFAVGGPPGVAAAQALRYLRGDTSEEQDKR